MFSRLLDAALIIGLAVALFGRKRLPDSIRQIRKSARIIKAEVQASADDVPLPEPTVIRGETIDSDRN